MIIISIENGRGWNGNRLKCISDVLNKRFFLYLYLLFYFKFLYVIIIFENVFGFKENVYYKSKC